MAPGSLFLGVLMAFSEQLSGLYGCYHSRFRAAPIQNALTAQFALQYLSTRRPVGAHGFLRLAEPEVH